jgi:hypothetical protein
MLNASNLSTPEHYDIQVAVTPKDNNPDFANAANREPPYNTGPGQMPSFYESLFDEDTNTGH